MKYKPFEINYIRYIAMVLNCVHFIIAMVLNCVHCVANMIFVANMILKLRSLLCCCCVANMIREF